MNIDIQNKTIGEIVAEDYRAASAFRKFGLDFCCGGKRGIIEACAKKGVDPAELQRELEAVLSRRDEGGHHFNSWPPDLLVEYITSLHHAFVRRKVPEIAAYAKKVSKVHGNSYPVLNEMREVFLKLKEEMLAHLEKEESMLFPYIKSLVAVEENGDGKPDWLRRSSAEAVQMLEEEHEEAGRLMARLEELSEGFTPPEDACTTFRIYFQNLEGFRDDLHKHVHLENNILFPKALELERRLN